MIRVGVLRSSALPAYNNCSIKGWYPTKSCLQPGADVEIMRELFSRMNVTYELVVVEKVPELVMLGMNNTIDTAVYSLTTNSKLINRKIFDFTNPVTSQPFVFIYKAIDDSVLSSLSSFVKPFSPITWFCLTVFVCLLLSTWLIVSMQKEPNLHIKPYLCMHFEFFDFFQGYVDVKHMNHISMSKKLFFIFFYFLAVAFSALYQNGLLLSYRDGKTDISLASLSDLVNLLERGELKIVTEFDDWHFFWRVQTSDGDLFKKLNSIFLKSNYIKVNSREEVEKYLMTGKFLYPTTPYDVSYKYKDSLCPLTVVNLYNENQFFAYVFKINSTFLKSMNAAIMNSWPAIDFYMQKYKLVDHTQITCTSTEKNVALKLKSFSGPFLLHFIGISIGVFTFICEILKVCK